MKITFFFLITMIFGASLAGDVSSKKEATTVAKNKSTYKSKNDARIDFILGSWTGTGYVTDANGLEQYIEIEETNSKLSNGQYEIAGTGKNPGNDFVYTYDKSLFFNHTLNSWNTKGTIDNTILPDSRTDLGGNNSFSYSYYDANAVLVRHTTSRDSEDCFREIQEKWGQNGWEKTASFRMMRKPNY